MVKKRKAGSRPGRGTKGLQNPLLTEADQGRSYVVKSFIVQPEVTLLDKDGKEDRRYLGPQIAIFEAQLGETFSGFAEKRGFKLSSNGNGK